MTTDASIPQNDPPEKDLSKSYWLWSYNSSDDQDYNDFEGPFNSIEDAEAAFTHDYYPYVGTVFNDGNAVSEWSSGKWERVNE